MLKWFLLSGVGLAAMFFAVRARASSSSSSSTPADRGAVVTDVSAEPRGIRNNNPGNLRDVGIAWRGLVGRDEAGYAIFDTPLHGLRAMARDLDTGFVRDGEDTVEEIINEYAPPSENPTARYIAFITAELGVDATTRLDRTVDMPRLMRAIIRFENGKQPYSDALIDSAIREARTT